MRISKAHDSQHESAQMARGAHNQVKDVADAERNDNVDHAKDEQRVQRRNAVLSQFVGHLAASALLFPFVNAHGHEKKRTEPTIIEGRNT